MAKNSTPEKAIQDQIYQWLVYNQALVIRVNSGAAVSDGPNQARRFIRFATWQVLGAVAASAGVSDILCCYRGRFVAIECKAPGKTGNVSELQAAFLAAVEAAGGVAIVADSLETVEGVLCQLS